MLHSPHFDPRNAKWSRVLVLSPEVELLVVAKLRTGILIVSQIP